VAEELKLKRPPSASGTYGSRGKLAGADSGIRRVAPTFGKVLLRTHSVKAEGTVVVESDAERLVSHMLTIDPGVISYRTQPFTVDLIDRRLLRTPEAVSEARKKHRHRLGRTFYTPDFAIEWADLPRQALEVKRAGYEGDTAYDQVLAIAGTVLASFGYRFAKAVIPSDPMVPLLSNLPLLKKALGRRDLWPTPELLNNVNAACGNDVISLRELCQQLGISANLVPILLVSGAVSADLAREPINGKMMLQAAFGDCSHLQLLEGVIR